MVRRVERSAHLLGYHLYYITICQESRIFFVEFDHYEPVPAHAAEKVIEEARKRREEAHA